MGLIERMFDKKNEEKDTQRQGELSEQTNPQRIDAQTPKPVEEPLEVTRVYEGYYFSYRTVPNGWGGYHPVNLTFNHDEKGLQKPISSGNGTFLEFPGVVEGSWRKYLEHPFREQIEFVFNTGRPSSENELLTFYWMVQPDGRYYADEDGFGMEDDEEIVLVTGMDRQGRFTGPFHEKA